MADLKNIYFLSNKSNSMYKAGALWGCKDDYWSLDEDFAAISPVKFLQSRFHLAKLNEAF